MKALSDVFPKVRLIGCLFHFKQALWRAAGHMGLKSKILIVGEDNNDEIILKITSNLIDELSKFSWQERKSMKDYKEGISLLKTKYKKYPNHIKLIVFYESNWLNI